NGNVSLAPMLGSNGQPIGLFGPGAKLDFSLSVDSNLMSALRLELPDAASGIVLQSLPIADVPGNKPGDHSSNNSNGATTQTAAMVPEPWSCILWGVLVVGAVARNRWRRIGRQAF